MKLELIAIVFVVLLVASVLAACRRQSSDSTLPVANALLSSYLAEGRNYRVIVGMPLNAPTKWREAQVVGQSLSLDGERLDQDRIAAFLVVYPNGEVLAAQNEFFPLPKGVKFLEMTRNAKQDVLDVSLLELGKELVTITFGTSASRPDEPGYYSTAIRNMSNQKLRVTRFAGFTKSGAEFRLNTVSGDYFSADEFISWYGVPQDGWIAPGSTVVDPNNYGSGGGYWVYYFENESGETFIAGDRSPK
jgi:hypothetical protein